MLHCINVNKLCARNQSHVVWPTKIEYGAQETFIIIIIIVIIIIVT